MKGRRGFFGRYPVPQTRFLANDTQIHHGIRRQRRHLRELPLDKPMYAHPVFLLFLVNKPSYGIGNRLLHGTSSCDYPHHIDSSSVLALKKAKQSQDTNSRPKQLDTVWLETRAHVELYKVHPYSTCIHVALYV